MVLSNIKHKCPINEVFYITDFCPKYCQEYPKGNCPIQVIERIIKERKANDTGKDRQVSA